MTRETDQHEWDVPEPGDTDYAATIAALADAIDEHVPIDPDTEPEAQTSGRIILNRHRPRDVPVLDFDDGVELRQIETAQRWDVHDVLWKSRFQEVIGEWTFTEPVDADITGNATFTPVADEADVALDADELDGRPPSAYARLTAAVTVNAPWEFEEPARFSDGFEVDDGSFDLPVYEEPQDETQDGDDDEEDDDSPEPTPTLSIQTGDATGITASSVTLRGQIESLGAYSRLYAGFDLRNDGLTAWEYSTATTEVNATGTVRRSVPSGAEAADLLEAGETYEYRLFVTDGPDSRVAVASPRAFTLDD